MRGTEEQVRGREDMEMVEVLTKAGKDRFGTGQGERA